MADIGGELRLMVWWSLDEIAKGRRDKGHSSHIQVNQHEHQGWYSVQK
jgi:hypothetical protein